MYRDQYLSVTLLLDVFFFQIKNAKTGVEGEETSAADLVEEEPRPETPFDEIASYKKMLDFMKPKETVKKALQRLGKSEYLSVEKFKYFCQNCVCVL